MLWKITFKCTPASGAAEFSYTVGPTPGDRDSAKRHARLLLGKFFTLKRARVTSIRRDRKAENRGTW